jgi:hypothetical protein
MECNGRTSIAVRAAFARFAVSAGEAAGIDVAGR